MKTVVNVTIEVPTLVPLPELGVIEISGGDAVSFLQSQLTNDVVRLAPDQMQLSGYCTPKGRLLATFHQWRVDDTVYLRTPRELVPSIVKRLSMFVMRAKAKLVDVSDAWTTYALIGSGATQVLTNAGLAVPASPLTSQTTGSVRVDRVASLADGTERFLLTLPSTSRLPLADSIQRGPSSFWWLTEIRAAVPTVFAATQEKFVPQMLNLEVLGAVDFKKGCYPGQEIVARSQYLGKLKRRMNVAHVDSGDPRPGSDIFHSASEQPVGMVVLAAASPNGGSELLFESPVDRLSTGTLHLQNANGPQLMVHTLPYALFDPTD